MTRVASGASRPAREPALHLRPEGFPIACVARGLGLAHHGLGRRQRCGVGGRPFRAARQHRVTRLSPVALAGRRAPASPAPASTSAAAAATPFAALGPLAGLSLAPSAVPKAAPAAAPATAPATAAAPALVAPLLAL
jgi:hypothetical protein